MEKDQNVILSVMLMLERERKRERERERERDVSKHTHMTKHEENTDKQIDRQKDGNTKNIRNVLIIKQN
jgi:hypothetical protein